MDRKELGERLLIVDASPDALEILRRNLTGQGYVAFTASSVAEALSILDSTHVDLVVTDDRMPQASGLDLVRHIRENSNDVSVIVITGNPSIGGAVEAVREGAEDYLAKPFTEEELSAAVKRALERLRARRAAQRGSESGERKFQGIIGESYIMQGVYDAVEKAAATTATVLIMGESGTGKELVARAIHYRGPRVSAPFVPVNCGGIPEGLMESELFGHVRGAFTGATEARAGFFQTADGGTIFLDEISEMSLSMQVKLLRVLQDKEIYMVGDSRSRKVDTRILAATNKDLRELVKKGLFREDLYFRLSVITISVPRLRERGDDLLLLASQFARKYAQELGKPPVTFADDALRALRAYDWPGNVRELENIVQRTVVMTDRSLIRAADLPGFMRFTAPHRERSHRSLAEVEREHIQNVLDSVGGNKSRAADILGIDRKTLRQKLREGGNEAA